MFRSKPSITEFKSILKNDFPGLMIDLLKNGCISYLYPIPEW